MQNDYHKWDGQMDLDWKDWAEFPVKDWYNGEDEFIKSCFTNPSFIRAGWNFVIGEWWKEAYEDSKIPRIYFSYEDYRRFTEELLQKIKSSEIEYDAIVTMPKGGVAIGAHIARELKKPLGYFHANSYVTWDTQWEMTFGEFHKSFNFPLPNKSQKKKKILLVDDLADSGNTFLKVKAYLESLGYEVDTAAIFHKDKPGVPEPTYCVFPRYPNLWIVQPTEGHIEDGPTKDHPVGDIGNHHITQKMHEYARFINSFLQQARPENNKYICLVRFYLPSSIDMITMMTMIGMTRALKSSRDVEFIPWDFLQFDRYNYRFGDPFVMKKMKWVEQKQWDVLEIGFPNHHTNLLEAIKSALLTFINRDNGIKKVKFMMSWDWKWDQMSQELSQILKESLGNENVSSGEESSTWEKQYDKRSMITWGHGMVDIMTRVIGSELFIELR